MFALWKKISELGIRHDSDLLDQFYIKLTNRYSIFMLIAIVTAIVLNRFAFGHDPNLFAYTGLLVFYLTVLLLNFMGNNNWARWLSSVLPPIIYYSFSMAFADAPLFYLTYFFFLYLFSLSFLLLLRIHTENYLIGTVIIFYLAAFFFLDRLFPFTKPESWLPVITGRPYWMLKWAAAIFWSIIVAVFISMKLFQRSVLVSLQSQKKSVLATLRAQKEAEAAFKISEAENRSYVNAIREKFILNEFSPDGTVLNSNAARSIPSNTAVTASVIGQKHSDFDQMSLTDPEGYSAFWGKLRTGNVVNKETHYKLPTREIWMAETYAPLVDRDNQISKIIAISNNITGRIRQEAEREKEKEVIDKRNAALENYTQGLLELVKCTALTSGTLEEGLQEIMHSAAELSHTHRVSFWESDAEYTQLTCACLYDEEHHAFQKGMVLLEKDFPSYFKGLKNENILSITDAHTDPFTFEFSKGYLSPNDIYSMLDVPVIVDGQIIGVVCFEHCYEKREWQPEDRFFAKSMADMVTMAVQQNEKRLKEREIQRQNEEISAQNEELKTQKEEILTQKGFIEEKNQELKENELRLFSILENIPMGLTVVSKEDRTIYFTNSHAKNISRIKSSPEATRNVDVERNKLILVKIGTNETYPEDQLPLNQALEGKTVTSTDLEILHGTKRTSLEVKACPIYSSKGELEFGVTIFQDVTERRKHERQLKLMQEAILWSKDAIWLTDEKSRIIQSNRSGCILFGVEHEYEIIGKTPLDFSPERQPDGRLSRESIQETAQDIFEKGTLTFEWKHCKADGTLFDAEVLLSAFSFQGERMVQVAIRDISERKQASEQLKKLNRELVASEEELQAQHEELITQNEQLHSTLSQLKETQSQLVHSEKMATLGQLTAGIAHEINNPINYINSGIKGLKKAVDGILEITHAYDTITPENAHEILEAIEALKDEKSFDVLVKGLRKVTENIEMGVQRTVELVRELRVFARSESQQQTKMDLYHGINSTLLLLRNQYKGRIRIVREFMPVPEIICFPGRINQVFMNILSNAIQAIEGEGTISIRLEQVAPQQVKITISDDGIGIPVHLQKRIFEPFFTTKPTGKGTGLGLSITAEIIRQHEGEIEVESQQNIGTNFYMYLPVHGISSTDNVS